jgi:lipid II:glycine glycyltransferase (peptidoglycan interpeptide bridge formation enzyme)
MEGIEAIDRFMVLYQRMRERKAFSEQPVIHYLPQFYVDLPEQLRPRVIACQLRGAPVAVAVLSVIGDTGLHMFGATANEGLEVGASNLLHWWVVGWLKRMGCRWYDIGGGYTDSGLRQFKSGLVGRCGLVAPLLGKFDVCHSIPSLITTHLATCLCGTYLATRNRLGCGRML